MNKSVTVHHRGGLASNWFELTFNFMGTPRMVCYVRKERIGQAIGYWLQSGKILSGPGIVQAREVVGVNGGEL